MSTAHGPEAHASRLLEGVPGAAADLQRPVLEPSKTYSYGFGWIYWAGYLYLREDWLMFS